MTSFICLNGSFVKSEEPVLTVKNRAFQYGDGLFETIHCNGTEPQFFELHFERMKNAMNLLEMEVPAGFTADYLKNNIRGVLTRNKHFQGARVRITIFRNDGGLYSPENNTISFVIESSFLESDTYFLNERGLNIDIFSDLRKPLNPLSGIKSVSALLFVKAGLFRKRNRLDDCIILNDYNRVCESVSSNVFIVKNNKVLTPGLSEGCLPGVMRQAICGIVVSNGCAIDDHAALSPNDLNEADEMFLTNAVNGIRWVLSFRQKRYYNKFSKFLNGKLNETAFGSPVD
jgi:branched-subunit amino acid aminotransferase/4-amino-4-deoxychorismate lyase